MSDKDQEGWVALSTWVYGDGTVYEAFYEAGGVYPSEPNCSWGQPARRLDPGEPVVECPRCGQRFAATDDDTAEGHRDLHFDGDEDCPSICRHLPPRRLRVVDTALKGR